MDDKTMLITMDDGKEVTAEIILTFDSEEFGKSYVLFTDANDQSGIVHVMSFDDKGNLYQIESDEEWNMAQEVLEAFNDEQQEEN